jgi:hypothetical protein
MPTSFRVAVATVVMGTAFVAASGMPSWISVAVLAFGMINVIFPAPRREWVSAIAVAAAIGTLLWPPYVLIALILGWVVWLPVFIVSWVTALHSRKARTPDALASDSRLSSATAAHIAVAALILAVTVASIAYRLIVFQHLDQTSALFVGIPALLAVIVLFGVSPQSATGAACKAVTVALLVSSLFLGEGILCVFMSAPLFYGIAIAIANSASDKPSNLNLRSFIIVLSIAPLSLEGVTSFTTLNREEAVTVSKIVRGSSRAVEQALFQPPRFDRLRPLYLRAGFPSPISSRIAADRTRWVIEMRGGEMRLNGMEARTGDLVLDLQETRAGFARWRAVSDTSHMTHFLTWREAIVQWEAVDAQTTKVTWTLRYRRDLDPSFYFGPMERYAVRLAAEYLIDAVATP